MVDLAKEAERLRAKKLAKRQLLDFLKMLTVADQHEILLEALMDLDEGSENAEERQTAQHVPPTAVANGADSDSSATTTVVRQSGADDEQGPTKLILRVLREAAPARLKAPNLIERIRAKNASISPAQVFQTLPRMVTRGVVSRSGKSGDYRYTVDSSDSNDDRSAVTRVMDLIKVDPRDDRSMMAMKVYGNAEPESRRRIRNTLYYLHHTQKWIAKRPDGSWEIVKRADA